jgi:hypothetical protein
MASKEIVSKARRSIAVFERYDLQELTRVGGIRKNVRKDWTPAQIRRMRKRFNKKNMTHPILHPKKGH